MNFAGENISLQDALFVDHVTEDLETWRVKSSLKARVLVFPPVNNYHRFLIHKVVETGFPEFTTFSVGEGVDRRTVVCFQQHLLDFTLGHYAFQQASCGLPLITEDVATSLDSQIFVAGPQPIYEYQPYHPLALDPPLTVADVQGYPFATPPPSQDIDFQCHSLENETLSHLDTHTHSPEHRPLDMVQNCYEECVESALTPKVNNQTSPKHSPPRCQTPGITPTKTQKRRRSRSKRPDNPVYVPPRVRGKPPPNQEKDKPKTKADEVWKLASDDQGIINIESSDDDNKEVSDDATDQVVNEITAAVGGVHIDSPLIDYSAFKTSETTLNLDQFGHVIELYDFPEHLKTNDLMTAFHEFTSRWDIKWVDDTHALGVFSSAEVAAEALAMRHPQIKSRPLNMATSQSKSKAKAVCEFLLPYKQRPATSTGPARRLLQWALGSDKKVPAASKEDQDRLREAIKKKEEERRKRREKEKKLDNGHHS